MKPLYLLATLLLFSLPVFSQQEDIINFVLRDHALNKEDIVALKDRAVLSTHEMVEIDSAFFTSDSRSTIIIVHNLFDVETWISSRLKGTQPTATELIIAEPIWKVRSEKNYYFELDSLNRVTYAFRFDHNGQIISYYNPTWETLGPAIFEYWYNQEGQLEIVQSLNLRFGAADEWGNASSIKLFWKDSIIRQIDFRNPVRKTGEWNERDGLSTIDLTTPYKEQKQLKMVVECHKTKDQVEALTSNFPPDTTLYNCYLKNRMYSFSHDAKKIKNDCANFLCNAPSTVILSDTINGVIRYLWLLPDAISMTFYTQNDKLIKIELPSEEVRVRNKQSSSVFHSTSSYSYPLIKSLYPMGKNYYLYEEYLDVPDDDSETSLYYMWTIYKNKPRIVSPRDFESQLMTDFNWYDLEIRSFLKKRLSLIANNQLSIYGSRYEEMLSIIQGK